MWKQVQQRFVITGPQIENFHDYLIHNHLSFVLQLTSSFVRALKDALQKVHFSLVNKEGEVFWSTVSCTSSLSGLLGDRLSFCCSFLWLSHAVFVKAWEGTAPCCESYRLDEPRQTLPQRCLLNCWCVSLNSRFSPHSFIYLVQ